MTWVLPLSARIDLRIIRYFTLLSAPKLEAHHQIQLSVIPRRSLFWRVSYPSARDTVSIF